MIKQMLFFVCATFLLWGCSQSNDVNPVATGAVSLDSEQARFSYAIGMQMGDQVLAYGLDLDRTALAAGIIDQLDGVLPALNKEEALAIERKARKKLDAKIARDNLMKSEAFLTTNGKKKGVIKTHSGLQYEVIKMGKGSKPKVTDQVRCHYKGTLIDGKAFNPYHSYDQVTTLSLGNINKGLAEGLQLMPVGSVFRFFIPPELAYDERGRGSNIAPNTVLVFKVELLSIIDTKSEK